MLPFWPTTFAFLMSALPLLATCDYIWPNPETDELEGLLYEQDGLLGPGFAAFVANCDGATGPESGRSTGAEWVRTAYHDMATADVHAGTGGIDASIIFETDRAENPGSAFQSTRDQLLQYRSPRTSFSDLFAAAAVVALGTCSKGQVVVPLRAGRIDASGAGPAGVPEPQQNLESHTESFRRQGFNVTEMIALVACGHSLGGVHAVDFPFIVTPPPDLMGDGTVSFDTSSNGFDNIIAAEFVANISQNPLAFGPNETTRSDARIFNADGGATISKLASSTDYFYSTCAALMERMINTVPRNVNLTDEIRIIPVKPRDLSVVVLNGTLTVSGTLRIINTLLYGPNSQVSIYLKPRSSSSSLEQNLTIALGTYRPEFAGGILYPGLAPNHTFYTFSTNVSASQGVSSFTVEIKDPSTGKSAIQDNMGFGFPFPDVIYPQMQNCTRQFQFVGTDLVTTFQITAAIWNAEKYVNISAQIPIAKGDLLLSWDYVNIPMVPSNTSLENNYTLYTAFYTTKASTLRWFNIVAQGPENTASSLENLFPLGFAVGSVAAAL